MTNPQPLIPLIETTILQTLRSNTLNSHKALAVAQQINEVSTQHYGDYCVSLMPAEKHIEMVFDMPEGTVDWYAWDLNSTQPPAGIETMIHDALTILLGEEEN